MSEVKVLKRKTISFDEDAVRMLRVWHWRKCRYYGVAWMNPKIQKNKAQELKRRSSFHMRMVQILNDLCPIGTTAESDSDEDNRAMNQRKNARQG